MLLSRNRLLSIYTLLVLLGSSFVVNAQSSGISPYSRYGIGDLDDQNGAQSFSMGQTGTALNPWAILETGKRKYYLPPPSPGKEKAFWRPTWPSASA